MLLYPITSLDGHRGLTIDDIQSWFKKPYNGRMLMDIIGSTLMELPGLSVLSFIVWLDKEATVKETAQAIKVTPEFVERALNDVKVKLRGVLPLDPATYYGATISVWWQIVKKEWASPWLAVAKRNML